MGQNLSKYTNFPRLIGECGGKNYHFIHPTAEVPSVVAGTIRSAFEFCGQKCSACSRMYVPESLWPQVYVVTYVILLYLYYWFVQIKEGLLSERSKLKIGDPTDPKTFTGAVIDDKAFKRIKGYVEHAKSSSNLTILGGGKCDDRWDSLLDRIEQKSASRKK